MFNNLRDPCGDRNVLCIYYIIAISMSSFCHMLLWGKLCRGYMGSFWIMQVNLQLSQQFNQKCFSYNQDSIPLNYFLVYVCTYLNRLFLEQFLVHSKIEWKIRRVPIYPCPHTCMTSPFINISHHVYYSWWTYADTA